MRAKKKRLGTRQTIRNAKERKRRVALSVAVLVIIIFISGFLINSLLNQPPRSQTVSSDSQRKAAIVDHLSLTYPNQTFIQTTTDTLKQAGYTVDYYPGEEVTVEFYRNLPTHGYKLIILRVHSSATQPEGADVTEGLVTLFTSERVSQTKYVYEQLTDHVRGVAFSLDEKEKGIVYFGIPPVFVTQSMKGRFENTVIIMIGCEGLRNTSMARAFIDKGAKVYVSWNGSVLASYTDQATTHLLQHYLTEKLSLRESVIETFKDMGADPAYNSLLVYYPLEAGSYTMQSIPNKLVTSAIRINLKGSLKRRRLPTFTC